MIITTLLLILVTLLMMLALLLKTVKKQYHVAPYSGSYPSVTIIKPVKGLDVDAANNFRAALSEEYPGELEVIFVFEDASDPAYAVARDVINEAQLAQKPCNARIILSGAPTGDCTGKLHNMIAGERVAKHDLIAFSDSDTRPSPSLLRVMVETLLRTPQAGATFVTAASDQALQKAGDAFYALLQNALYAPFALLAAGPKRTLPFIMGQYMLFTRESLQKIGGVACAKGQLVDDMFLGKKLHEAGFVNVIAPAQLSLFSQGLSFKEFIPIYRKWFQFGRNGLPFSFLWRQWVFSICFFSSFVFLIVGIVNAEWSVAALATLNLCIFSTGLAMLHRCLGGARFPFRFWWVPPAILLVSIGVMVLNRFHRKVNWRGHVYELDERAALSGRVQPDL